MKKTILAIALFTSSTMLMAQSNLDAYIDDAASNTYTVIANSSDQVTSPVDLEFNPLVAYELWVLNQGTNLNSASDGSGAHAVIVQDAGLGSQSDIYRKDGNAWHFAAIATSMAFGDNNTWATAQGIWHANTPRSNSVPLNSTFTGPTLWSSDLAVYAMPSGGNGSHLDMLHQSPLGMGIAHDTGNAYFVFCGARNTIDRYDFKTDHGPGNAYHGDGEVLRYDELPITMDGLRDIPSHMVIDETTNWMYIANTGDGSILRMDIRSGTEGANITSFTEGLAKFKEVDNVTWETYVTGLNKPSGIALQGDRLLVSDNASNEIISYDISGTTAAEVGRFTTTATSIMGLEIGPDGKIWYVDKGKREVVRVDNPFVYPVGLNDITFRNNVRIAPNPGNGVFTISLLENSTAFNGKVDIFDLAGKLVHSQRADITNSITIDLKNKLQAGFYMLQLDNGAQTITEKLVIQ